MNSFSRTLRTMIPIIIIGPFVFGAVMASTGVLLVKGYITQDSWILRLRLPWVMGIGFVVVVLVILARAFFADASAAAELKVSGLVATATVTAVRDPGLEVDGRPWLELALQVSPQDAQPFEAVAMVPTSLTTVHKYQAGLQLRVRYDNNDHSRVVVDE